MFIGLCSLIESANTPQKVPGRLRDTCLKIVLCEHFWKNLTEVLCFW